MPSQALLGEGVVKGGQMCAFCVGQGAVNIKYQRFEHQITSNMFIHPDLHPLAERPGWRQSRTQSGCVNHRR